MAYLGRGEREKLRRDKPHKENRPYPGGQKAPNSRQDRDCCRGHETDSKGQLTREMGSRDLVKDAAVEPH